MFYLILFLFLVVCGGLAALTILNFSTQVHLVIFSWRSPDLPIGMWLLMAFFLGAFLLYLVSVASAWSDRREIKRLRKSVTALRQQLLAATPPAGHVTPPTSQPPVSYSNVMPMPSTAPPEQFMPPNYSAPHEFREGTP
ncbi:LapA family protein [Dictyobacter arantiisoli]|uniref:Lipopolysaccharide assembly protein A domain-containing protein n=1 Tax=Dictyobacter arantiisoli TaxID=2014874 RepID=A0A5A5T788_9CHLR|nr:LapA family protein [Dictyobacter arantiisoli]GCF07056.1 hypothetical protein KDI_06200 [Dictyobacter arantiisoli]